MAQGRVKIGVDIVKGNTSGIDQIKTDLQSLKGLTEKDLINIDSKNAVKELQEIKKTAELVETALEKSFNVKLGSINVSEFKKQLDASGKSIKDIQNNLTKAGAQGQSAFRNLSVELLTTNKHMKQSNELLNKMADTLANTVRWSIASTAVNAVAGSIQKAWHFTKDLDTSLNDIQIVTKKSAAEMDKFAVKATRAAQALGGTTKSYADAALIYYQQGLSEDQVAARSDVTVKVANVTGQSAAAVSEQLTAVWNGYKVSAEESEQYIDKLSAVAASTAADLEELSTGMSKVASAANIMGVDIDQLNAQLATIVSVTREAPESIGTALKTVYARMSDIEAGLDTETTLGEYTAQMAEMGINVLDTKGNLRDMGDVVEEIGDNWNNLNRNQQTSLAQTIAGTRQYSRMMALFDNWDMYQESKNVSESSAGELQKQQDIYLNSLEAHINKLTAESEELYQTLMDPEGLKPLVDVLTQIVGLVENVVQGLGGGKGLLGIAAGVGTTIFRGQITKDISRGVENYQADRENRKLLKDEAAIAAEIDVDKLEEEQAQKLINLKKAQLKVSRSLTEEEVAAQDSQIKQTNELYNQNNALKEQQKRIDAIAKKQFLGEKGAAFDEEGYLNTEELEKSTQSRLEEMKKARISTTKLEEYEKLGRRLSYHQGKKEQADSAVGQAESNKEIFEILNQDQKGTEKYQKFEANHQERINEAREIAIEKTERLTNAQENLNQAFINEGDSVLEQIGFMESLISSDTLSVEQKEKLSQALSELKEVYDENGELKEKDAESIQKMVSAYKAYNEVIDEQEKELTELEEATKKYNKEKQKNDEAIKDAEKNMDKTMKHLETMSSVDIFSKLTSGALNLCSALEQIIDLGSIWSDDDLSTGEKLLQTFTKLAFVIPMISSGVNDSIKGLKNAGKLIKDFVVKVNTSAKAQKEQAMAAKQAAKAETESAQSSEVKAKATEKEKEETEKATQANNEKAKSEDGLQKEMDETSQESREKADSMRDEAGATKSSSSNESSDIPDIDLPDKTDKADDIGEKATKEVAEEAGEKAVKKASKGAVKGTGKTGIKGLTKLGSSAGPAIAAIGAAIIAIIATVAVIDLVSNAQKRAMDEAQESARRADENLVSMRNNYDNLTSSIDRLKDTQSSLNDLTEGTIEWKKALNDVNSEVLALLEEYPELASYISRDNKTGALTIDEDGLELIQEKQLNAVKQAEFSSTLANQKARDKELEYLKDEWAEDAVFGDGKGWAQAGAILAAAGSGAAAGVGLGAALGGGVFSVPAALGGAVLGGIVGGGVGIGSVAAQEAAEDRKKEAILEDKSFQKVAEAYASSGGDKIFESEQALAAALGKLGKPLNDVEKALLQSRGATIELIKAYNADQVRQYQENVDLGRKILGEDATEGQASLAGEYAKKEYADEETLKKVKAGRTWWSNELDHEAAIEAMNFLGVSYDKITTDGADKVQVIKGDQSTEYTMDEIYEILAQKESQEKAKAKAQDFETAMAPIESKTGNEDLQNKLGELTKDGGTIDFTTLTMGGLSELKNVNLTKEDLQGIASTKGRDLDELWNSYQESVKNARDAQSKILEGYDAEVQNFVNNLGVNLADIEFSTYSEFAQSMATIYKNFGPDIAESYKGVLQSAGDQSDDLINSIMSTEWSGVDDIEGQMTSIAESLNLTFTPEQIKNLTYIGQILANESKSLQQLQEEYSKVQTLIDKVQTGAQLSAEEYDKLTVAQKKYFTVTADGTAILTGNAVKLKKELKELQTVDAKRNFDLASGQIITSKENLDKKREELINSDEYKQFNDDKDRKEWLDNQLASFTTIYERDLETRIDSFLQWGRTLDSDEEVQTWWENNQSIVEELKLTAQDLQNVMTSVAMTNLADQLNIEQGELNKLWMAYDGNTKAIEKQVLGLERATLELEKQQKILQELEEIERFLGSDEDRLKNLKAQKEAYTEALAAQREINQLNIQAAQKGVEQVFSDNVMKDVDNFDLIDFVNQKDISEEFMDLYDGIMEGVFDEPAYGVVKTAFMGDESLKKYWDEIEGAIEGAKTAILEADNAIKDLNFSALDINLEYFELKFQIAFNKNEAKREIYDFQEELLDDKDIQSRAQLDLLSMETLESDINTSIAKLNEIHNIQEFISEEQWKQMSNTEKEAAIASGIIALSEKERMEEELKSSIMEDVTTLREEEEQYMHRAVEAQERLNSLYDEYVGYIETANSLIEHQMTLQNLLTGKETRSSQQLQKQAELQKAIYNSRNAQFQDAKAAYDALDPNRNDDDAKSIRQAYYDAANSAYEALISMTESYKSVFSATLTELIEDSFGIVQEVLEDLEKEQNWLDKESDRYFDNIDKAYQLNKLGYNFRKAINDSSNPAAQSRLNELLKKELEFLQSKEKLTKADLDRSQKRLELEQARIALEQAQESKTKMRLMRGADGSYSYQYVADQNAIDEARQKVEDLENELVNLDEDAVKQGLNNIANAYKEFVAEITEAFEDGKLDEREEKILRNAFSYVKSLVDENDDLMKRWAESLGVSFEEISAWTEEDFAEFGISKDLYDTLNLLSSGDFEAAFAKIKTGGVEAWLSIAEAMGLTVDENGNVIAPTEDYDQAAEDAAVNAEKVSATITTENQALLDLIKNVNNGADAYDDLTTAALKTCAALAGVPDLANGMKIDPSQLTAYFNEMSDALNDVSINPTRESAAFDTGGYTGAWGSEGKFLLAHEKELILNKQDTANILQAVDIVRSLSESMFDTVAGIGAGSLASSAAWELAKDFIIEQTVNINAEFPNATDKSEIEAAFEELINLATQHAYEDVRGR